MRQPAALRFVAHVRTVGKIVRTELAHEDRIEERRLVRGAPRGVEFGFVRTLQHAKVPADQRESVVPAHRHIMIDRTSTRLKSSHYCAFRMPSAACKERT